jgi:hypothetical protein
MVANDAAILFVMFVKPELIGSLTLLIGANVVTLGLADVRAKTMAHA